MSALADARQVAGFIWTHPANRGRRLRQLAKAAMFQAAARTVGRRTVVPVGHHGGRIWVDLHRTSATKALYANPPDWPHMLVWEHRLQPGDLFVDVGANVGSYSALAVSLGARVIAIEAAPETAAVLRENAALNASRIEVVECAVGASPGTVRFTAGQDSVNHVDPENGPTSVLMRTLDEILGDRQVAGMKIDVEGYELEVLRGTMTALADRRIHLIQLEWNECADRAPVVELLTGCGYRLMKPTADGDLVPFSGRHPGDDLFAEPQ